MVKMKSIIKIVESVAPPILLHSTDTRRHKELRFNHAIKFLPFLVSSVAIQRSRLRCESTHLNIIALRNNCFFASSLILEFLAFQVEDLF
jgi:hypothetical protein